MLCGSVTGWCANPTAAFCAQAEPSRHSLCRPTNGSMMWVTCLLSSEREKMQNLSLNKVFKTVIVCLSVSPASYWQLSRKALRWWSCGEWTLDSPAWTPYQERTFPCTSCSASTIMSFRWMLPDVVTIWFRWQNGWRCDLCSLQVVFLYERSGNYLWHGALRLKGDADRSFAAFKVLDYGRYAGAYDRCWHHMTTLCV